MSKYKLKDEPKEKDPLDDYLSKRDQALSKIRLDMQQAYEYLARYNRPQSPEKIKEYVSKYLKKFNVYPTSSKIVSYFTPQELKDKYQKNRSEWIQDNKQIYDSNPLL